MNRNDFKIHLTPYSVARLFEVLRSMRKPNIHVTYTDPETEVTVIHVWNEGGTVLYTYSHGSYAGLWQIMKQLEEEFGYVK